MLNTRSVRQFAKISLLCFGIAFSGSAVIALFHTISFGAPSLIRWAPNVAATAAAGFGTTAAIFFAMYQHFKGLEDSQSERKLNAAMRGIQQAWDILSKELPTRNIAWVNAARLILRARKLADGLTNKGHTDEWALFVEEWKIRFLPFLSAKHEYYFGYGNFESFPPEFEVTDSDIQVIAKSIPQQKSVTLAGYSSTLYANSVISERAIRAVYQFTRIYDHNDDPIQKEQSFTDQEIEDVSNYHLNGLLSFLKIQRKYLFNGDHAEKRSGIAEEND